MKECIQKASRFLHIMLQSLNYVLPGDAKNNLRVWVGCEIKSMRLMLKTEMLINQSKVILDEEILFGKVTRNSDPEK